MQTPTATPEQADKYWRDMGEPPSSRAYLRTIYFDGQPVVVREPAGFAPCELSGDAS
jgi:hypothetical protein